MWLTYLERELLTGLVAREQGWWLSHAPVFPNASEAASCCLPTFSNNLHWVHKGEESLSDHCWTTLCHSCYDSLRHLPFWSWYLVQHQVNHSRITSLHIRHWTHVGYYCSHLSRIFDPSTNTTWKLCMCQWSRETIRQNHFFDFIMSMLSVIDDLHRWEAEKWGLESTI